MIPLVSDFFSTHGYRQKDIEKAVIYESVMGLKETTRKRLCKQLRFRPNNVSDCIQELVDDNLVAFSNVVKNTHQGRPEVPIKGCPDRLVAASVWIDANILNSAIVDVEGNHSEICHIQVPEDASNALFMDTLIQMLTDLFSLIRDDQIICGIGIALPGFVDSADCLWVFNARFPNVRNLNFDRLKTLFQCPVSIHRLLDAQLDYLVLSDKSLRRKTVYLIHWGYGLGASLLADGKVLHSSVGSTFEIGHMKVSGLQDRICTCGERGCLDTGASLQSLLPDLQSRFGEIPKNETEMGSFLSERNVASIPSVENAVHYLSIVLDNLYRMAFPDRVIVYGPMLGNQEVRDMLLSAVMSRIPLYGKSHVEFTLSGTSLIDLNIHGNVMDLFDAKLKTMLVMRN
ncbi:MAG: ROK family protein [Spirochaetales bacterium]|nr:ROK family protein [Spirochaetales bacterium]